MRCNICKGQNHQLLFSNFKKKSARHQDYPLDVVICRDCGLVSLDLSNVTEATLAQYYSTSNTFEKPSELFEGHRPMREQQVSWVLDNLPKKNVVKTILDVGCGAGYVLKLFKDKGYKVWGADFSPAMIENLKKTWGIDGYQGKFDPAKVERQYDMLTCICALEHMLDPNGNLGLFSKCLTPEGFLAIEVPDAEFPRWDMVPDHIAFDHLYHWTERTLGRQLEQNGFQVLAVAHIDNPPDSGNPECTLRVLCQKTKSPVQKYSKINDYDRELKVMNEFRKKHDGYLAGFQKKIDAIKKRIGSKPLAVFCGGEHTATLLSRFDFSGLNIPYIFDNDPAITGQKINGIPIRIGSEAKKKEVDHYLLSTTNHERSIYKDLKAINPNNQVYGLYTELD